MKTSDFYYDLPEELIAQEPLAKRDESRLMVLDKNNGEINHKHFYALIILLIIKQNQQFIQKQIKNIQTYISLKLFQLLLIAQFKDSY